MESERKLVCYTRNPRADEIYAARLAYSMHLGWLAEDGSIEPLNHDFGVLFASATQDADGTLHAKCLTKPWLFALPQGWGVLAIRCETDGAPDDTVRGTLLLYTTKDLVHYTARPVLNIRPGDFIRDLRARYDAAAGGLALAWRCMDSTCHGAVLRGTLENLLLEDMTELTDFPPELQCAVTTRQDVQVRNAIPVGPKAAQYLNAKLATVQNIENRVPQSIVADAPEVLDDIAAVALYSDGTSCCKPVDWQCGSVDWEKPGRYTLCGRVHQPHFPFPVARWRADPCLGYWEGRYYFIATNDADANHTLWIRRADTVEGLQTAKEYCILSTATHPEIRDLLWAPEFHVICGRLCIFHGGTLDAFEQEQCFVMPLRVGGDPCCAQDWEPSRAIVRKDGSPLYGAQGITLDMTCFEAGERLYGVWSQRQFQPKDLGAWLYMAELEPDRPWVLRSDPFVLSLPEYGWENNHVFVLEGPFALVTDSKVCLSYTGSMIDETYAIGMLTADIGSDLLDPASWTKCNYPLQTSLTAEGEYGPGHNAFFTDADGFVWNSYHAHPTLTEPRCTGIRRVHWDVDGEPRLDLTEPRDLDPALAEVRMTVVVPER